MQLLLVNGADVNARGGEYESSLIAAAQGSKTEVARLLLVNGADANARGEKTDAALSKAAALGHLGIVSWLLKTKTDPNVRDRQGRSVLEVAVHEGHVEIVRMLLQEGVKHGRALKLAAYRRNPDIVELLLQNGATVESNDPDSKHVWKLILSLAVEQDNPDLVKSLLTRKSVIIDLRENEWLSFLDEAPLSVRMKMLWLLLREVADARTGLEACKRPRRTDTLAVETRLPLPESDGDPTAVLNALRQALSMAPLRLIEMHGRCDRHLPERLQNSLRLLHTRRNELEMQNSLHLERDGAPERSAASIFDELDSESLAILARTLEEQDRSVLLYQTVSLLEARRNDGSPEKRAEAKRHVSNRENLWREYREARIHLEDRLWLELGV